MDSRYYIIIIVTIISITIPSFVYATEHHNLIQFDDISQYIAFETKMKNNLNMPITARNYETGHLEPTKQATTDYTLPIFHENKTDSRVIVYIDRFADKTNQNIIDEHTAKERGWFPDRDDLTRITER